MPGSRADSAFLLAEQVDGRWLPCWAVNLVAPGESAPSGAVSFVDAVSGVQVARQG
ncbi:hypothetical protein [Kitasatospora sp. NPDC094015]|uniref:hypothetical protein n=1 Tax=Kitasatospora sp. NPDC094015 TaxID=3155205 RepID=UPI003319354D